MAGGRVELPLHRGKGAAEALWADYVIAGGGEGIVAVRLDAKLGARRAKSKVRNTTVIDCCVLSADRAAARLLFDGKEFVVSATAAEYRVAPLVAGEILEVLADGEYPDGTPKFARILRRRPDLSMVLAVPQ